MRVTNSVARHKRKKRLFKLAKGAYGDRKNHLRQAMDHVQKALSYQFVHRKLFKRNMRRLWTVRLNAACRMQGISYSKFIDGLKRAKVELDRKVMADIAFRDPACFAEIVKSAKQAL
ncbi:MAG: 50S ribosomal protein L20 [Chlamydiae bacterium]|nr:50S ribosomal protein L20 [Chlamydiota bacterium]